MGHFRSEDSVTDPDSGLVVPKHGRGRIKRGGNHGNKGGGRAGRRAITKMEQVRDMSIEELERRLNDGMETRDVISLATLAARHTVPIPKSAYDADLVDELWDAMEVGLGSRPDADNLCTKIGAHAFLIINAISVKSWSITGQLPLSTRRPLGSD